MAPPTAVTRTLYRSLLRTARQYGQSPVLCSLLHRTGRTDRWDPKQGPYPCGHRGGGRDSSDNSTKPSDIPEEELHSVRLPPESARDLSRGYDELRRTHYRHTRAAGRGEELGASAAVGDDGTASGSSGNVIVEGSAADDGTIKIEIIPGDDLDSHLEEYVMSKFRNGSNDRPSHEVLFRKLLQEVMGGGDAQMRFPSHIVSDNDAGRLEEVVRREFRAPALGEWDGSVMGSSVPPISAYFTNDSRREAAFLALRELNRKLVWAESLGMKFMSVARKRKNDGKDEATAAPKRSRQAAKDVYPMRTNSPSSYLRPGTFLVAHPLLPGYFSRAVIVILEHTDVAADEDEGNLSGAGGTYGVIVNRPSMSSVPTDNGALRPRALREVLRPDCIPPILRRSFGDSTVREGGPVNVSVQMLSIASPDTEEALGIGGTVLPMVLSDDRDEQLEHISAAAVDSDLAVYFNGDLVKAAGQVFEGKMDRDDFSFLVGASVWSVGQLQSEIERGFWIPCRGPPQIAYSGMCEHLEEEEDTSASSANSKERKDEKKKRPKPDLWLSMMCAAGEGEAELAQLIADEGEYDVNGEACDDF